MISEVDIRDWDKSTQKKIDKVVESYRFAQFAKDQPYMELMPDWLRKDLYEMLDALEGKQPQVAALFKEKK